MTTPDTTPEAVAHAVARWHGYARHMPESNAKALLIDACDLIEALAADRDGAIESRDFGRRMAVERSRDRDAWKARAERAEAALAARTAAEYPAAFVTDAAARARLADDRAGIPPTERDRRETSGESDPWASWREAPTIGDMAMCGACGKPIRYIGPYWQHTTYTPRHIATPAQEPRP